MPPPTRPPPPPPPPRPAVPTGIPLRRREFIAAAGAGSLLAGVGAAARPARRRSAPAKNLILMVCDGAGTAAEALTRQFLGVRGEPSHWAALAARPDARHCLTDTASADSIVPESAATASCWGIGERVNNEALNFTPDGRTPDPLFVRAKKAGKAAGLVTTTRLTDATPAAMAANVPNRDLEAAVAEQMLRRGMDLLLGGGARYFTDELLAASPGVRRVTPADLDGELPAERVVGAFTLDHFPWMLDRPSSLPSLERMMHAALAALPARGEGFVVQVEGGLADKAAHRNDAAGMMFDLLEFDRAVGVAAEFALGRGDTLLVVTADHDCALPGLTFYGADGLKRLERLNGARRSFAWIEEQAAGIADPAARVAALPALAERATGVALRPEEADVLRRAAEGQRVDPFAPANGVLLVLGSLLANYLGVAFLSPNHTSAPVSTIALGPGAERLPARGHHVDVARVMAEALGI